MCHFCKASKVAIPATSARLHVWTWLAGRAGNVGMAGGLALLQGKLAILALHDLEFLIVRASRKLLLAAGALVKRHSTHGAGFQHGAESVH